MPIAEDVFLGIDLNTMELIMHYISEKRQQPRRASRAFGIPSPDRSLSGSSTEIPSVGSLHEDQEHSIEAMTRPQALWVESNDMMPDTGTKNDLIAIRNESTRSGNE